jgi:hypothetical protein
MCLLSVGSGVSPISPLVLGVLWAPHCAPRLPFSVATSRTHGRAAPMPYRALASFVELHGRSKTERPARPPAWPGGARRSPSVAVRGNISALRKASGDKPIFAGRLMVRIEPAVRPNHRPERARPIDGRASGPLDGVHYQRPARSASRIAECGTQATVSVVAGEQARRKDYTRRTDTFLSRPHRFAVHRRRRGRWGLHRVGATHGPQAGLPDPHDRELVRVGITSAAAISTTC